MRSDRSRNMLETISRIMDDSYEFDLDTFPPGERVTISYLSNGSYVERVKGSIYKVTKYGRNYMARNKLIEPQRPTRMIPRRDGYPVLDVMVGGN